MCGGSAAAAGAQYAAGGGVREDDMKKALLLMYATTLVAAAPASPWKLEKKSDPISDAGSVSLTLKREQMLLLLQCDTQDAEPFSITVGQHGTYLGGRPIIRPTIVRFDKGTPSTQQWGYTSNFAVAQERQRQSISSMATAKVMAIRLQDGRGAPVDLVFDLTGAPAQISNFKKACAGLGMTL